MRSAALALAGCVLAACIAASCDAAPQSVAMKIMNHAGAPVDLFWVGVSPPGGLVKQNSLPIRNGTDASFNTYDSHSFVVKWAGKQQSQDAEAQAEARFTHGKYPSTVLVLPDGEHGLRVEFKDTFQAAFDSVSEGTNACLQQFPDVGAHKQLFLECVTQGMTNELHKLNSKITTLQSFNTKIANRLRNYTCVDPSMESSTPVSTSTFNWAGRRIQVGTLYDSERAKIMLLEDFITDDECNALMKHGSSRLQRATVSGDGGTIVVSNARQAQQATYVVDINNVKDPLFDLKHRIFGFTNSVTGYNLTIPGQEDFTIIQYNPNDQYMPHCDGACDGSKVRTGGRVATVVLYCKAATVGGGTSFSKADVFVQPKKGNAVFFAYMGSDGTLDDGLTEHSGCPVVEGEKWITTQWMRFGISEDNPWKLYDPLGGRVA